MQFRLKNQKGEKKRQKKEQKRLEKEQKEADKKAKKNMKDKKATKATTDKKHTHKKKGRTAVQKERDWKPNTTDMQSPQKAGPEQDDVAACQPGTPPTSSNTSPVKSPVKSRQMKKLRKMRKAVKKTQSAAEISYDGTVNGQETKKKRAKKTKTSADGNQAEKIAVDKKSNKKAKKTDEPEDQKMKTDKKSKRQSAGSKKKSTTQSAAEEKTARKHVGKVSKPKSTRARAPKQPVAIDPVVKGMVVETLKECDRSHCTHPSFVLPKAPEGGSIMPYWSRNAVGVLVAKRFVENKRKGKQPMCQIAYFGGSSPCPYSNYILAGIFVSSL